MESKPACVFRARGVLHAQPGSVEGTAPPTLPPVAPVPPVPGAEPPVPGPVPLEPPSTMVPPEPPTAPVPDVPPVPGIGCSQAPFTHWAPPGQTAPEHASRHVPAEQY